jgi:hypothetical protein
MVDHCARLMGHCPPSRITNVCPGGNRRAAACRRGERSGTRQVTCRKSHECCSCRRTFRNSSPSAQQASAGTPGFNLGQAPMRWPTWSVRSLPQCQPRPHRSEAPMPRSSTTRTVRPEGPPSLNVPHPDVGLVVDALVRGTVNTQQAQSARDHVVTGLGKGHAGPAFPFDDRAGHGLRRRDS